MLLREIYKTFGNAQKNLFITFLSILMIFNFKRTTRFSACILSWFTLFNTNFDILRNSNIYMPIQYTYWNNTRSSPTRMPWQFDWRLFCLGKGVTFEGLSLQSLERKKHE